MEGMFCFRNLKVSRQKMLSWKGNLKWFRRDCKIYMKGTVKVLFHVWKICYFHSFVYDLKYFFLFPFFYYSYKWEQDYIMFKWLKTIPLWGRNFFHTWYFGENKSNKSYLSEAWSFFQVKAVFTVTARITSTFISSSAKWLIICNLSQILDILKVAVNIFWP